MAEVRLNEDEKDPKVLIGQGVRGYTLGEYDTAVAAFSKACEIITAEKEDQLHDDLGDIYLRYGKSLLELWRTQSVPFELPKRKNSEDTDDEDEEEGENEERSKEAATKDDEEEMEVDSMEKTNGDKVDDEEGGKENTGTDNGDVKMEGASSENGEPSTSDGPSCSEKKEGEEEEAGDDLQIAWEVLELAKTIFERQGDKGRKQLADTMMTLGEVSLENERFEDAINDIRHGLDIQIPLYPDSSRVIAESFFKLGVAYGSFNQFDEAIDAMEKSLDYLERKISLLKQSAATSSEDEMELDEIKELLPKIAEKIEDLRTSKQEMLKKEDLKKMMDETPAANNSNVAGSSSDAGGSSGDAKPNDISHLVRRKRKIEDENGTNEDVPLKKAAV